MCVHVREAARINRTGLQHMTDLFCYLTGEHPQFAQGERLPVYSPDLSCHCRFNKLFASLCFSVSVVMFIVFYTVCVGLQLETN